MEYSSLKEEKRKRDDIEDKDHQGECRPSLRPRTEEKIEKIELGESIANLSEGKEEDGQIAGCSLIKATHEVLILFFLYIFYLFYLVFLLNHTVNLSLR
jgi:hypothetical protein